MHLCNFCRQIHQCTGSGGVKPISRWPGPPFPARANMCEWKSKSWRQRFSWWSGDTRVRLALEQCSLYFVLCPPGQDNPRWTMESEVTLMNSLKIWVGQGQWYWPTHFGEKRERLMLWCHTRCLLMEQVWHEERGEKCVSSNVVSFLPGELKLWWLCVVVYVCAFPISMEFLLFSSIGCPEICMLHDGRECLVTTEVILKSLPFPFACRPLSAVACSFLHILEPLPHPICRWHCPTVTFIPGWPFNINLNRWTSALVESPQCKRH